jgi:type 1 glutamine amidotransferase
MGTARFDGTVDDDVIVLYTAAGPLNSEQYSTSEQRSGLARAVRDGSGLIAFHSTTVDPLLFDLIGSRYVSHGPPPHESRFGVLLDEFHELTAGIAPFDVTHEHYHLTTARDVDVVAWREAPGGAEALVHVRAVGDGRVCYIQLGHDMRIWQEPSVRLLIRRAARWACRPDARGI